MKVTSCLPKVSFANEIGLQRKDCYRWKEIGIDKNSEDI
jgi:hypothetical protein